MAKDKIVIGNVIIQGVAYVGRNGRVYLDCLCARCGEQKLYMLEEEITKYDPDTECTCCKK